MTTTPQAPEACTLPVAERPDRIEEWDALFRGHVLSVNRTSETQTTMQLEPVPWVAAETAHLALREAGCCSFFEFTIRAAGNRLRLTIEVPQRYADVLAGLSDRADLALAQ
jgi:hypothetical protein